MITIKDRLNENRLVPGNCLRTGSTYRLVASPAFLGNIYLKGERDIVSLSNAGATRTPMACDRYVEVDLEITVKEKT